MAAAAAAGLLSDDDEEMGHAGGADEDEDMKRMPISMRILSQMAVRLQKRVRMKTKTVDMKTRAMRGLRRRERLSAVTNVSCTR